MINQNSMSELRGDIKIAGKYTVDDWIKLRANLLDDPKTAKWEEAYNFFQLRYPISMNTIPTSVTMTAENSVPIISVRGVNKTYASGFQALKKINLEIKRGEIFALLGPNGAGKTTLISIICGIVKATSGTIIADGHDTVRDYRAARATIGLVPQELHTDSFESVWATLKFSRGLFGKAPNAVYLEKVLRDLSLWDKRNEKIMTLSGLCLGLS